MAEIQYQIESLYVNETTDDEYQVENVYLNEIAAAGGESTIELPALQLVI